MLAIIALRAKEEIIARQVDRLRGNLDILEAFFSGHRNLFDFKKPLGGSICFPRLCTGQAASAFCEDAVTTAGIMLVPSSLFDYGDDHIRIGFGRQDMPVAIEKFSSFLDRYGAE